MSLSIGFITWIVKKDALDQFHNAKVGESMISDEVSTQNMQWHLRCYPNGSKHKFENWVGLSLTLKKSSIPEHITNILVRYYLYESQSSSISRGVARFNTKQESGYAKSNGTNYLVELDQLKQYDIIILKCEFEIIRMYQLHTVISGDALKLNKILCYEWNICDKALERFKSTNNAFTRLYSEEFNIWSLVLVPSTTTYNSKGNISLRLRLHELPPNIQSIQLALVLSCTTFNRLWCSICDISYDVPWIAWPANTLKKAVVDSRLNANDAPLKTLTFECKIEIISITLREIDNIENVKINDADREHKSIWNQYIMDKNNVFMKTTTVESKEEEDENDEFVICKKEDLIRMNILKSVDLNEEKQKLYVMNYVYSMTENIRVLRQEKQQNTQMMNDLQSVIQTMQNEMKLMQQQIQNITKEKNKENDNEKFIKRMKKEKAKRDKDKNVKKKQQKSDTNEKEKKEKEEEIINENENRINLTAKQQLFRTWISMVVHLPQYFELFVESGYDDLTYIESIQHEQDLIEIGVTKRGHRQKILQEIRKLKPQKDDMCINTVKNNNDDDTKVELQVDENMDFMSVHHADIDDGAADHLYLDQGGW